MRRYSRFTFVENTISNSPNVQRAKFLGSDRLFCLSSICKFGSFKNPFAMITSLSELYFRFRTFILLVQTKKSDLYELWQQLKQLKTMEISRLDLIFTMNDIYINSNLNQLTKLPRSNRSTEFKDILTWNISRMITKTFPISTRIVICYAMKRGILLLRQHDQNSPLEGKPLYNKY